MADEGRKQLARAIADSLSTKQNKPDLVPALIGAYVNGQKTLVVAGRPDFLWVRLRGNTSEPVKAFNGEAGVGAHWDLPVLVFRDEVDPNIWKIYGRDVRVYQDYGGASYLPRHGYTHSFGGSGSIGNDVAWIYKRQWMPLLPRPNATGTMSIYIEPGFYFTGDQYKYWPGSGTTDLTSHKPTGAFNGNFVTIYLDAEIESLAYLKGPELNVYAPPFDPGDHIGVPPLGAGVPIAAVWLVTGTTDIGWFDIYDLRATEHVQPTGTAGVILLDEGLLLGQMSHIDFRGGGVAVTRSGSFADVSITAGGGDDRHVAVFEDGIFQVTGTVDFTDDIEVSVSGTRARVSVVIPPPPILLTNVDQFVTVRREGQFVVTGTLNFVTPFSASVSGSSARIGLDAAAIDHGALSGLADDDHGHYLKGLEAYKDSDQEITNTTLADDSELSLILGTGSKYGFEFRLFVLNDGVAEGYKVALGGSVGFSDLKAQILIYDDTLNALAAFARITATGTSVGGGLGIGNNYAEVKGSIRTTTSGTFVLQFAQNAVGASAGVHNEIGSTLVVTQLE